MRDAKHAEEVKEAVEAAAVDVDIDFDGGPNLNDNVDDADDADGADDESELGLDGYALTLEERARRKSKSGPSIGGGGMLGGGVYESMEAFNAERKEKEKKASATDDVDDADMDVTLSQQERALENVERAMSGESDDPAKSQSMLFHSNTKVSEDGDVDMSESKKKSEEEVKESAETEKSKEAPTERVSVPPRPLPRLLPQGPRRSSVAPTLASFAAGASGGSNPLLGRVDPFVRHATSVRPTPTIAELRGRKPSNLASLVATASRLGEASAAGRATTLTREPPTAPKKPVGARRLVGITSDPAGGAAGAAGAGTSRHKPSGGRRHKPKGARRQRSRDDKVGKDAADGKGGKSKSKKSGSGSGSGKGNGKGGSSSK